MKKGSARVQARRSAKRSASAKALAGDTACPQHEKERIGAAMRKQPRMSFLRATSGRDLMTMPQNFPDVKSGAVNAAISLLRQSHFPRHRAARLIGCGFPHFHCGLTADYW
jgi:hypothetical protein